MPQSLAQVYVHLIFGTKHRKNFIDEQTRPSLQSYMIGVLAAIGSHTEELFVNPDHAHILCTLPRTMTIASMFQKLKTSTSKWMKEKGKLNFQWQDGYAIFSVSSSKKESVVNYILNQSDHHKKVSFQDELRVFFKQYNVEFDERYVWD